MNDGVPAVTVVSVSTLHSEPFATSERRLANLAVFSRPFSAAVRAPIAW